MKTILVATDYSPAAENATAYAAHLSKVMQAKLVLLNVFKLSIHASNSLATIDQIDMKMEGSAKKLAILAIKLSREYDIEVEPVLKKDDTVESLKNFASDHRVDLVVMGMESNLIEYKVFGNTTTEAIKLRKFPVLVVPNESKFNGIEKIVYACESSYLKEGCKLDSLRSITKTLGSHLEIFYVLTSRFEREKVNKLEGLMNGVFEDVDHSFHYINNPSVGDGIKTRLQQNSAEMLVMIPHKMGFFESITTRIQTNQMSVQTKIPLLVIPNEIAC